MQKVVGIVAEYNPFHKGHAYHLEETRRASMAEGLVVILSSHFVQRGEPALLDKWTRAKTALLHGANVVFELPVVFSCHNAGVFASAAVDLLHATGIVNEISFGMEDPSWNLDAAADILVHEPLPFKELLKKHLSEGYSYVESRNRALAKMIPQADLFLKQSNNALALAYRMRILQKGYSLRCRPILRIGAGYQDETPNEIASARGIRRLLREKRLEEALSFLPQASAESLKEALSGGRICCSQDLLWRLFQTVVVRSSPKEIGKIAEMREGLENRIYDLAWRADSWEELVSALVCKRYPRGRIQRHLAHILLGLDQKSNRAFQRRGPAYLRLLGADSKGRELLRQMHDRAKLPLLSRASPPRNAYAERMMHFEFTGGAIWEALIPEGRSWTEKRMSPLMLP